MHADPLPLRTWEISWYSIVLITGLIGNVMVITVITKSKHLRWKSVFNILLLALAVSDLLASVSGLPFYLVLSKQFGGKLKYNVGDMVCRLYLGYFAPFWFMNLSAYILVCVTLERKQVLLNTFQTLKSGQGATSVKYIMVSLLLTLLVQLSCGLGLRYIVKNETATLGNYCTYIYTNHESYVVYVLVLFLQTLIPFSIMLVSFRQMQVAIESADSDLKPFLQGYKTENIGRSIMVKRKEKTIRIMKLIVVCFFLCLLPHHVLFVLVHFFKTVSIDWNSDLYQITMLLWETNSCINPILYCFYSKEFRKHAYQVWRSFKK